MGGAGVAGGAGGMGGGVANNTCNSGTDWAGAQAAMPWLHTSV
jgi:hypothetical protein